MIAALSLGMKLFLIMLTATGHWQSMTYYHVTDTDYRPLWTISR